MICADTNVFVDFFRGKDSKLADALQSALDEKQLIMNPFVLSEILSSPKLPKNIEIYLLDLPRLEIESAFFERAGLLRRKIYSSGQGVSIADIYIAQTCIDSKIPILTSDRDLMMIAKHGDLDAISTVD